MRPLVGGLLVVAVLILGAFTCLVQVNETEDVICGAFWRPTPGHQPGRSLREMARLPWTR